MFCQPITRIFLCSSALLVLLSGCVVHPHHHRHQLKPATVVVKQPVVVRKPVVVRPVATAKVVVRKVVIHD